MAGGKFGQKSLPKFYFWFGQNPSGSVIRHISLSYTVEREYGRGVGGDNQISALSSEKKISVENEIRKVFGSEKIKERLGHDMMELTFKGTPSANINGVVRFKFDGNPGGFLEGFWWPDLCTFTISDSAPITALAEGGSLKDVGLNQLESEEGCKGYLWLCCTLYSVIQECYLYERYKTSVKPWHLEDQIRIKGSLRDILHSAQRGNKILDSTRIDIHMANPKSFGLGTDEEAILFVRNLENLRFVALGLGGGEWGRVATANVIQQWHVEDAGKASMLQLCRSLGCLVFAQPKIGSNREGFLRVGFEEAEDEGWDYYSVILESGDCWWVRFMGPLVPHLLFTLEPSLLKGSQFLFTWTMKESCYGLLDAFIAHRGITDAVYHDTLHVMVCVLIFWSEKMDKTFHAGGYQKNSHHLNPGKMEDLITILMVTNVVQLARVLDTHTYEGGMPSSIARAYGVGDAYIKRLLHWLEGNVWVTHSADKSQSNFVLDFAHEFLVLQAKALIFRRWMLQQRDIAGNVTQESAREVRRAIKEENFA
ncbi:hypothetical protein EV368DRAFT_64512 [Lentinula lateritia]|nr:hypothetical protein EV368DRAFT_64512 [Lentinula lateritia]